MKKTRLLFVFLIIAVLLAVAGMPAFAQESTEFVTNTPDVIEGTATLAASTPVATAEPTPAPEPTLAPTPPPVNLPPDAVVTTGSQLLLYLLLAALGGGGLLTIVYRFLEKREARDLGEKLYQGMPPEQQQFLKDVIDGYRDLSARLLDYFDAITDGKPNDAAS